MESILRENHLLFGTIHFAMLSLPICKIAAYVQALPHRTSVYIIKTPLCRRDVIRLRVSVLRAAEREQEGLEIELQRGNYATC